MVDRYAVLGNPIAHSRSPQIHRLFAAQTGQNIDYQAILVEKTAFYATVSQFFAADGRGCNITVPFKQEAWQGAAQCSERAQLAQAANTLYPLASGGYYADNTDGVGLLTDLTQNLRWELKNQRILLLGAGGAAQGVIVPLLQQQPALLTVANRTADKAMRLATAFQRFGLIEGCGLDALHQPYNLIINATSAGLQQSVPAISSQVIGRGSFAYDMVYADQPTAFMRWAQQQGAAQVVDGLGMLVEQAAEAFYIWHGLRPATQTVMQTLRSI